MSAVPPDDWALPRLRVDTDGDWFDGDEQVTHPGVLANLRANLRRDGAGYFIQTRVRIPVDVADTPFVVERIVRAGETLRVVLNDGTEAVIDPASITIGRGDIPYCAVPGRFEARLTRAATLQLLGLADHDERTGRGTLRLGDREYPIGRPE